MSPILRLPSIFMFRRNLVAWKLLDGRTSQHLDFLADAVNQEYFVREAFSALQTQTCQLVMVAVPTRFNTQ